MEMAALLLKRLKALDEERDVRIGKTDLDAKPTSLEVFDAYLHGIRVATPNDHKLSAWFGVSGFTELRYWPERQCQGRP